MQAETQGRSRELCEKAIAEQDPQEFLLIITELNHVLAQKQERFAPPSPKSQWSAA